jgi:adenylosuccinate lyase
LPGNAAALGESERHFIAEAARMKREAEASGDQPFGAVVVKDGSIIGYGPSRVIVDRNPDAHAERVALWDAQRRLPLALEAMQTEHEADRTTSLMMDAAEARACIATGDALSRLSEVVRGLRLDPERMRHNLQLGGGLIMAEAVMLELGAILGRQHAHDVVYDAAQAAFVAGRAFSAVLSADPRVTAHLGADAIDRLLDPIAYTGLCAEMAKQAAARARSMAPALLGTG